MNFDKYDVLELVGLACAIIALLLLWIQEELTESIAQKE